MGLPEFADGGSNEGGRVLLGEMGIWDVVVGSRW